MSFLSPQKAPPRAWARSESRYLVLTDPASISKMPLSPQRFLPCLGSSQAGSRGQAPNLKEV